MSRDSFAPHNCEAKPRRRAVLPVVGVDDPGAEAAAVITEVVVIHYQEQSAVNRNGNGLLASNQKRLGRLAI